jgi:DNA polymerase-3 subunit chi
MTRIDFYFNVPHIHRQVAILGEKEVTEGRRVFVLTPDAAASRDLETMLWSHVPTGFLPHCRSRDRHVSETPLVIDWDGVKLPHDDILINLQPEYPAFFSRFQRLIELVGLDDAGREAARIRYRFYRDRGYEIRTVDVAEARA